METQFYGDGQHNGGVFYWGNLNPYIYTYQNPIRYIDPNGKQTEGYQSDEAKKLSEIVTIRGKKYHKNTVNTWASFKNWVNSTLLGGDDDFWVEKKPYDPTDDRFIHELVDNSAGSLAGGAVWKFGGKLLSRTIFKETGQILLKFCFAKCTLINTESGNIPVEQIKVGDKVWSHNKETNTNELKDVTAVFKRISEEMLYIKVQNIDIMCTPEHPFYVNGIWVKQKI
ncbi:hypothetical protein QF023_001177 [Chryseobacterium sp. SLBN-27]|uniref:Hint domain-containing protein n=1 Tax=Chryseobacterium sp. SLBN-27 TaxID=3042287 RepID=UPI0028598B5C|nr:polymorphic toxin-type HINT domain-containing protein [Chryseobacterium sp. SLBN-27]MDR6157661.1 hypothetical protein [Chryseobacterium sp. SLBN-27]